LPLAPGGGACGSRCWSAWRASTASVSTPPACCRTWPATAAASTRLPPTHEPLPRQRRPAVPLPARDPLGALRAAVGGGLPLRGRRGEPHRGARAVGDEA